MSGVVGCQGTNQAPHVARRQQDFDELYALQRRPEVDRNIELLRAGAVADADTIDAVPSWIRGERRRVAEETVGTTAQRRAVFSEQDGTFEPVEADGSGLPSGSAAIEWGFGQG